MRFKILCACVLCLFLIAPLSIRAETPTFLKIISSEPSFSEILNVYYMGEGLTNHHIHKWQRKIKTAPLLPTLYAGYDHSLSESQGLSINDNISVSDGTVTIGPEDNDVDFDEDLKHTFRVRAVWRLDELVFNRDNFLLAREWRSVTHSRSELGQKLYQLYEKRCASLMQYLEFKNVAASKARVFYSRYLLLTDHLDALTGGRFHKKWWKKERNEK